MEWKFAYLVRVIFGERRPSYQDLWAMAQHNLITHSASLNDSPPVSGHNERDRLLVS